MTPAAGFSDVLASDSGDLAHGVVEGQAQDLDAEVNGIAGQISFRPAPIAVFDDEAGIGGQNIIIRLLRHDLEAAFLEQWNQRGQSGRADLFAGPAGGFKRGVGHSLSSSGVE